MAGSPLRVQPAERFPRTRRVTADGVPASCAKSDDTQARKAAQEFTRPGHVPSWALPHYIDRPADHDLPIGCQPGPERDERPDLSQLLAERAN
jgi:hypothetical protein